MAAGKRPSFHFSLPQGPRRGHLGRCEMKIWAFLDSHYVGKVLAFCGLLFCFAFAQGSDGDRIKSAGCVVYSSGHLLLVKDIWSRKWQLPGGGCMWDQGETPRECAERETLEETGLRVMALHPLKSFKMFRVFYCLPLDGEPISVLRNERSRSVSYRIPPPVSAKNEIEDAGFFSTPDGLSDLKMRFPGQKEFLMTPAHWKGVPESRMDELQTVKNSKFEILNFQIDKNYFEEELKNISKFRAYFGENDFLKALLNLFNIFGEEKFYFALLPLIWLVFGKQRGFEFAFLIVLGAIANGLLKNFFELPRPRDFVPSLDSKSSSGFGFPSGHVQIAFSAILFLTTQLQKTKIPTQILGVVASVFVASGVAVARVFFGAHFVVDVVGGLISGLLCFLVFVPLGKHLGEQFAFKSVEKSRLFLFLWSVVGALLVALYRPHPDVFVPVCFLMGLLAGIQYFTFHPKQQIRLLNATQTLFWWVFFVSLLLLIPMIFSVIAGWAGGKMWLIIPLKGIQYVVLGIVLSGTQLGKKKPYGHNSVL